MSIAKTVSRIFFIFPVLVVLLFTIFMPLHYVFAVEPTDVPEYIGQFGSAGTGNGQMQGAYSITLDGSNNIYVADRLNNRIQKFSSSGVYLSQFGSAGSGNGQLNLPRGVGIDEDGYIYVADYGNNRIQKFDQNGNFISKFGSSGSADGQFLNPAGLAFDSDGNIFVVDGNNNRIQKFDQNGNFISKFGSQGFGDGQFNFPNAGGIIIDSEDNIYVADTYSHRIQKFDQNGTFLAKWGTFGTGNGQFNKTTGMVMNSTRAIYVVDYGGGRIQKFAYPDEKELIGPESNKNILLGTPAGVTISCSSAVAKSSLVAQDLGYTYPLDLVDFCLAVSDGVTTNVTLTFETNLKPNEVIARKYSALTGTYTTLSEATINEVTLNGDPALELTYEVTDGGQLDNDGLVNGTIIDPVGLAVLSGASTDSRGGLADTGQDSSKLLFFAVSIITFGLALSYKYNYHKN